MAGDNPHNRTDVDFSFDSSILFQPKHVRALSRDEAVSLARLIYLCPCQLSRRVVLLRDLHRLEFPKIGERLGVGGERAAEVYESVTSAHRIHEVRRASEATARHVASRKAKFQKDDAGEG